jgi:hypothetical protein
MGNRRPEDWLGSLGRDSTTCCPTYLPFAAGRTQVGARFIVHSSDGGRGGATPLPVTGISGWRLAVGRGREIDGGRAEHPCSAAAGQGWPALPVSGNSGWRLAVGRSKRNRRLEDWLGSLGRDSTTCCPIYIPFAAGRTQVGARFIVHSYDGGRGGATPLPVTGNRG